ncbi:hypothetical protein Tco_1098675 [Tanacetum coccineum]
MFRGGRGFVLVCECEWKWGVSVVGLVVMGSAGGGFSGDGGAGDGEVVVETKEVSQSPVNYFLLDLPLRDDSLLSLYIRCSTDESIYVQRMSRYGEDGAILTPFACLCRPKCSSAEKSYKSKLWLTIMHVHDQKPRENTFGCEFFLWKEERVRLLVGSLRTSTTPIYSPGSSSTLIYSPGSSTHLHYSPRASTPQSYSPRTSRNAECSNCKHLLEKIPALEATVDMYMHPEQHTVNSAALFHEVYNNMGKLDLELFVIWNFILML